MSFKRYLKELGRTESTQLAYADNVATAEKFLGKSLRRAKLEDLQGIRETMLKKEYAPQTINLLLSAVTAWMAYAVATGIRNEPWATDVKLKRIKVQKASPKHLSGEQVRNMLRITEQDDDHTDAAIVWTIAFTGLRSAELLGLKWGDIDFEAGTINVRASSGKGEKQRLVPLPSQASPKLEAYLKQLRLKKKPTYESNHIFRIQYRALHRRVSVVAQRAGIPQKVSPHTLRHSFAYGYLRANKGDVVGLANVMGHSSLDMAMVYAGQTLQDLQRAVEGMVYSAGGSNGSDPTERQ